MSQIVLPKGDKNSFLDKHPKLRLFWKQRYMQMFALSGIVFILIFNYIPMVGIVIAFNDYRLPTGLMGMFTSQWVGLRWFREFFNDPHSWPIIRNTLHMSIAKMVFIYPVPIVLALMLNEIRISSIKRIVQTASYLPYFISWVIVAGFAQLFLRTDGVINSFLLAIGSIESAMSLQTSPDFFMPTVVFTAMWKDSGWWAIIFLASIAGIDPTLYEAAEMDGAGRLKRIWYITLPGIKSTITIVTILALGNLLGGGLSGSNFEQAFLLGNAGNAEVSEIIQTYVMRIGLTHHRFSFAAAIGLLQSVISLILVLTSNYFAKKVAGEGLF